MNVKVYMGSESRSLLATRSLSQSYESSVLYSPMKPCDRVLVRIHAGIRNVQGFTNLGDSVREYRRAVLFERGTDVSKHGIPICLA
jgi:hypothetical protein